RANASGVPWLSIVLQRSGRAEMCSRPKSRWVGIRFYRNSFVFFCGSRRLDLVVLLLELVALSPCRKLTSRCVLRNRYLDSFTPPTNHNHGLFKTRNVARIEMPALHRSRRTSRRYSEAC